MVVGKLARQRGEEEERQDEEALRNRAELQFLGRVRIELVGDEQDDRLLEQAVVERPEELGREERKEAPRAERKEAPRAERAAPPPREERRPRPQPQDEPADDGWNGPIPSFLEFGFGTRG